MKIFDKEMLETGNDDSRRESVYSVASSIRIKSGPLAVLLSLFADFSNNSTVHGVKYLGERRRHWIEKAFWVIAFCISFIGSSVYIMKIYEKWQLSPVIVSFAEKATPVWQIPFPAVTICPETKAKKERIDFSKVYKLVMENQSANVTSDELRNLEALAQVCKPHLFQANISLDSDLKSHEIVPLLKSLTATIGEESIYFCKWGNDVDGCEKYFSEIVTEEGFCYTFNALNSKEIFRKERLASDFNTLDHRQKSGKWTLEDGYLTNEKNTYPRRIYDSGESASLVVILRLYEPDFDYRCRGPAQGFKIILHSPGEIPRVSKKFFRVSLRQEVDVSVKPNMITTSEGLADYAPERRQCYFNNERNLTFFTVYTQSSCKRECLAAFTLKQCGCVKFSMPRDNKTRICSQSEISCYNKAEKDLKWSDVMQSLSTGSGINRFGRTDCNCLPSCTSIDYDADISKEDFDFVKVFSAYGADLNEFPGAVFSRLRISFKESEFITSKRSELFGLTDFLANCGGIIGLFMGVSILSLVEILYYITLRLACNLNYRRNKKNRKNKKITARNNNAIDVAHVPDIKVNGLE